LNMDWVGPSSVWRFWRREKRFPSAVNWKAHLRSSSLWPNHYTYWDIPAHTRLGLLLIYMSSVYNIEYSCWVLNGWPPGVWTASVSMLTDYKLDRRGSIPAGIQNVLSATTLRPTTVLTLPPNQWQPEVLCHWV
jgi:hypothetical protein